MRAPLSSTVECPLSGNLSAVRDWLLLADHGREIGSMKNMLGASELGRLVSFPAERREAVIGPGRWWGGIDFEQVARRRASPGTDNPRAGREVN